MDAIVETKPNQMSLRWNGFTDNIITSLDLSLGNQDFVDVTLVCEGGNIKAHRLILSACSPFFERIFKENICPHPVIVLKGISLSELEALLAFMYHGEARTYKENIPRLLEAAQFLEIRGLTSYECSQISLEPAMIPSVTSEKFTNITNDFFHTGVHSTTQEFSSLLPHVETFNSSDATTQRVNGDECQEGNNERIDIDIKQEVSEEEESNIPEYCAQTVSSQTQLDSKTTLLDDKVTSCSPKTNFSVQEMLLLQQQKKLAFYEPRPCPKCHKMYRDAATLRNHLSLMHEVLRHKISCSCGSLFPTKHDLYMHRKRGHKELV